jgi:hypothetical protein
VRAFIQAARTLGRRHSSVVNGSRRPRLIARFASHHYTAFKRPSVRSGGTGLTSVHSSKHRHSKVLWQRRVANAVVGKVLALGGGVLVLTQRARECSVRLLHVQDGSEQWRSSFEASNALALARTGQTAVCVASESLTLLNLRHGTIIQRYDAPQGRSFQEAVCAKKGSCFS